jgi:hypothetical protein
MKSDIGVPRQLIPMIPHWRYIFIKGKSHPEWDSRMDALAAYIDAKGDRHNLLMDIDPMCLGIYNTKPMRKIVEEMLLERCDSKTIATTLKHKFGVESIDGNTIFKYKILFFDIDRMSHFDVASYRASVGMPDIKAPPVPGEFRSAYMEYAHDEMPDLDEDAVLKTIAAQSFFRSQELLRYGFEGDSKYLAFTKSAMEAMEKRRSMRQSQGELPLEYTYPIEYPDSTAVDAEDLDQ